MYYVAGVCVVFNPELWQQNMDKQRRAREQGITGPIEPINSQRFFFGHNNDISCLNIHPNRRFVVSGQQRAEGPAERAYVCIWDSDTCNQLQRIDHGEGDGQIVAACFSGDRSSGKGGDILVTITGDDKHTIHVWKWMADGLKPLHKQVYLPGMQSK